MDKISLCNLKLNLKLFYGQFEVDYNVLKYSVAFIRPAFACNKNTENNDKYWGMVVQWLVLSPLSKKVVGSNLPANGAFLCRVCIHVWAFSLGVPVTSTDYKLAIRVMTKGSSFLG